MSFCVGVPQLAQQIHGWLKSAFEKRVSVTAEMFVFSNQPESLALCELAVGVVIVPDCII